MITPEFGYAPIWSQERGDKALLLLQLLILSSPVSIYVTLFYFRMLFSYVAQQHANGVQLVVTYIVSGLASNEVC